MNRRRTFALALAVTALASGVGAARSTPTPTPTPSVSPSGTPTPGPVPSATQSDGTLQILTYRGYAEYGSVSPRVNWVGSFEKETGCRIARLDIAQTAEELAARVDDRPYDVITAGPVLSADLIDAKKVQPIDPAKVSGYTDLDKRFRDMTTVSGKVYGVPYLWAYHEYVYDSTKVRKPSVEQVYTSERSVLRDSPLTIADAALAEGTVERPYELGKDELDRAAELLERQKDRTYWRNPIDLVKGFATKALDYAQVTPYQRLLLQKSGLPVRTLKTGETTGWADSWMLGAHVPDTTCAYRWLNWVTSADAQRDAAAWVGMAPANHKACKGRARPMCELYGVGDDDRLAKVAFAERPPGACRTDGGKCPGYDAWAERWSDLIE
ncbi:putative spermidine/putrescine transport system substrate-binding protein [Nonomuraea maritima]|uniref:Putative spermidine/putrescine transport system substrate-binding protein n=1 Tax=Nonomuraea maritima TaxID=683260 RepID=A0A1G8TGP4_9ACTN|nr:extracellular solute-binding protein [Nonomuraea maritima]SDJ40726.1 putative spermidine/putrescine transport system substrate-binding protein [Nonomuraea maritima]